MSPIFNIFFIENFIIIICIRELEEKIFKNS